MGNDDITSLLHESQNINVQAVTRGYVLPVVLVLHAIGAQMGAASTNQFIRYFIKSHYRQNTSDMSFNTSSIGTKKGCNNLSMSQNWIQKESSEWIWYIDSTEHVIGIFSIIATGILSDRIGRKPFLILPLVGKVLEYGFGFFVAKFDLPLPFLFVSAVASGVCGTNYGLSLACSASVADTTGYDKSRSFHLALINLYVSLGLCASQITTGYLIKCLGYAFPMLISAALHLFCATLIISKMRETLRVQHERQVLSSPSVYFRNIAGFYFDEKHLKADKVWKFNVCILAFSACMIPISSMSGVETLYELGSPFCLSSSAIGWIGAAKDLATLLIGTLVLKGLHRCVNDEKIAILGCLSGIVYYSVMAVATHGWMIYTAIVCGVLSQIPLPVISGILSRMVKTTSQGVLFANISLTQAISRLFGVTLFLNIFGNTQSLMNGFVFLVCVLFNIFSILFLIPVTVSNRRIRRIEYQYESIN